MKIPHALKIAVVGVALAGCAGHVTYRQGKELLAQGRYEEGLAKIEQASREAPDNAEYRSGLIRERDAIVQLLLNEAETRRAVEQFDQAEALYQRALSLDKNSERAQAGLRTIQDDKRLKSQMAAVKEMLEKKNYEAAREALRQILRDHPRHTEARTLLRRTEEQAHAARQAAPEQALSQRLAKPITLDLRDAPLRSALDAIFRSANVTYVLDKDVRADQRITLAVRNTRTEDALRLLLLANQLERKIVTAETVLIYPNTPAKSREYQDLVSRTFYIGNADIKLTLNMIKTLVKTKDVFIDEKLGLLVMKDTVEAVRYAEQLVQAQDMADPEVVLQVEVLEVATNKLLELGLKWPEQIGVSVVGAAGIPGTISLTEWQERTSDLYRITVGNPALLLNLRNTEGRSNLLANPRIRVKNREKAKVHIGEKVPVITSTSTATGFVSESVSYLDIGLKLDVEPVIYIEDEVGIKVGLEVSNIIREIPRQTGTLVYQVGTRNAATVLRLKDGETQILAGLISNEERMSANRIPGLGELPVLGRLFGSQSDTNNRTEIVLLMTPRIVRTLDRIDSIAREVPAGTEAAIGTRQAWIPLSTELGTRGEEPRVSTAAAAPAVKPPAPPAAQAQFAWTGPAQVKAGDTLVLNVAVANAPPTQSAPMQIAFDPQVLQVVEVREGSFFKQGGAPTNFTYRVDPSGTVFVGVARASGGPAQGAGDVVTVTFRALKAAPQTDVRLATISPLGEGGRPVSFSPAAPQKVAVVP
jgi:general secretion pathway protein D